MKKEKGFTLIELMGVIILMAAVSAITMIAVNQILKNNEKTASKAQIEVLINAAKSWTAEHSTWFDEQIDLKVSYLLEQNYLDAEEVLDPTTQKPLVGCIRVSYNSAYSNYDYEYTADNECLNGENPQDPNN